MLKLYLAGWSWCDIGRHPKVNLSGRRVGNVLNRQLANAQAAPLGDLGVTVYIERLEMILRSAWPEALSGNLQAIMVVLRVLKQEAAFYGLNLTDPIPDEPVDRDENGLTELDKFRQRYHQ